MEFPREREVGIAGSGKTMSVDTVMEVKPKPEGGCESTPLLRRFIQTEVIHIESGVKWVRKTPE